MAVMVERPSEELWVAKFHYCIINQNIQIDLSIENSSAISEEFFQNIDWPDYDREIWLVIKILV